jgi:hypothetical protein
MKRESIRELLRELRAAQSIRRGAKSKRIKAPGMAVLYLTQKGSEKMKTRAPVHSEIMKKGTTRARKGTTQVWEAAQEVPGLRSSSGRGRRA